MTLQIEVESHGSRQQYALRFPEQCDHLAQNEETCEVYANGKWRRLRLHDYGAIYRLPGLYEQLFAQRLQCSSPRRVVEVLTDVLLENDQLPGALRVLDLGAGNGMVGEQMRTLGIGSLVGLDIAPEAAIAANRDRPGLYDDYFVCDLCDLHEEDAQRILAFRPNALVTVAALGFGDIPPKAFATAFNLISTPAWVAFNIKETFLSGIDETGFSRLIRAMSEEGCIQIEAYRRYAHRLSIGGQRLFYVAMVARKLRPVPQSMLKAR